MYEITLESELFGVEVFKYDTIKEARRALLELTTNASKHTKKDGIERKVSLIVEHDTRSLSVLETRSLIFAKITSK